MKCCWQTVVKNALNELVRRIDPHRDTSRVEKDHNTALMRRYDRILMRYPFAYTLG